MDVGSAGARSVEHHVCNVCPPCPVKEEKVTVKRKRGSRFFPPLHESAADMCGVKERPPPSLRFIALDPLLPRRAPQTPLPQLADALSQRRAGKARSRSWRRRPSMATNSSACRRCAWGMKRRSIAWRRICASSSLRSARHSDNGESIARGRDVPVRGPCACAAPSRREEEA